jgi:hypothetical protein
LALATRICKRAKLTIPLFQTTGDRQKVLATVAVTVFAFTDKYLGAWIYATGSTKSRARLYRIGLTNNLAEITENFELYGLRESQWQEFAKGVEYEAFLVRRRS